MQRIMARRWHCFPTLLFVLGVSQWFCSAATRVLLRSMIITVSLFRSFLPPSFPYRDTKSAWASAFVMHATQKPKYDIEYSLLRQTHHFIRISSWIWYHPGWRGSPLCTGVCCRLHEYLRPWTWIWWFKKKKKRLIGLAEFQHVDGRKAVSASATCKIWCWLYASPERHLSVNNAACNSQSDHPRLAIRTKGKPSLSFLPDQKWQSGRNNILIKGPLQPVQSRPFKLTSVSFLFPPGLINTIVSTVQTSKLTLVTSWHLCKHFQELIKLRYKVSDTVKHIS